MKQYTTPEQTAKLKELGCAEPKGWKAEDISNRFIMAVDVDGDNEFNYSIGELMEMLPDYVNIWDTKNIETKEREWNVGFIFSTHTKRAELIDALFNMVVKLKEEG